MCGIIGGSNKAWPFEKAQKVLRHRGPDSGKVMAHEDITFAFARLAIIDLSPEADQPMASIDGKLKIVFNGEIYGYKGLREELIGKGHAFRTHSDTEVIINAYREWGEDFVEHLDGMFAIAIHDILARKLVLYRDRPGIKPLYYLHIPGKAFAFASELKGITTLCDDMPFDVDYTGVYDYLTYAYIPEPKSLYKNVFKLPPAHKLIFDLASKQIISVQKYWTLNVDNDPAPVGVDAAAERLRALVNESVKDQLVADVPVGAFLSGGMDSSVVVAEVARIDPNIKTYSIGFDFDKFDETGYAAEVAKHLGVVNRQAILSQEKMYELLGKMRDWYDEPYADTSAYPSFLVAQFAKKEVKVVLTGDGGDEVFGGYGRYRNALNISRMRVPNPLLNHFLLNLGKNLFGPRKTRLFHWIDRLTGEPIASYVAAMGGGTTFTKSRFRAVCGIPDDYDTYWYFRQWDRPDLPLLTRLQYLDFHTYLPSDILTKVDRVTMANSLEARVPLLSRKIVEYSFSLPEAVRYYAKDKTLCLKGLFKHAYRDSIPQSIINRKKMGFAIPNDYLYKLNPHKLSLEHNLLEIFFPEIKLLKDGV